MKIFIIALLLCTTVAKAEVLTAGSGTHNVTGGFTTNGTKITWNYSVTSSSGAATIYIYTVRPDGSAMSSVYSGYGNTSGSFGPQNFGGQPVGDFKIVAYSATTPFPGITLAKAYWDGTAFGAATIDKLPWTYTNTQDYDVLVEVVDAATLQTTLDAVAVEPGETVNRITTIPPGTGPVTFVIHALGVSFEDSIWLEDPDAETDLPVVGEWSPQTVEEGADPTIPPVVVTPTATVPTSPPDVSTPGGSVWTSTPDTTSTEALDKTTFRQGVDRITQAITQGSASQSFTQVDARLAMTNAILDDGTARQSLSLEGATDSFEPSSAAVNDVLNILPATAPTMPTSVGETGTFSADLSLGDYGGDFSLVLDLTPYETPIKTMRAAMLGLMGVAFFVSVVKTIRGGFAG